MQSASSAASADCAGGGGCGRMESLGLPFRLHPDEMKYVTGAALVHQGQWNEIFPQSAGIFLSQRRRYPLWMYLRPGGDSEWIEVNLSAPVNDIPSTYRYRPLIWCWGRYLSALRELTIVMIYLIGIQLHSPKAGLIAVTVLPCLRSVSGTVILP